MHAVTVPEQVPGRGLPGKGLDELLRGPLGGRVFGHVEVEDQGTHDGVIMRNPLLEEEITRVGSLMLA